MKEANVAELASTLINYVRVQPHGPEPADIISLHHHYYPNQCILARLRNHSSLRLAIFFPHLAFSMRCVYVRGRARSEL